MLVLRFAVSAALLVLLGRALDVGAVIGRLSRLDGTWVALGVCLSVAQVVLLAWRWRFTAARLGIDLPMGAAVREYYLGILLNQLLPGGVSGDVSRAWRHARTEAPTGAAVRAVLLERVSAQVVMTAIAAASLLALPLGSGRVRATVALAAALMVTTVMIASVRLGGAETWRGRLRAECRTALLARGALPWQLGSGVVVVGSYIAMYLIAARSVGIETETLRLLPLVAPVLMTMLIPVTVAGWGVREGAAAALWGWVGLTPEDGVSISVAYGLLVLVSSAPGVPPLIRTVTGGRSRTRRPTPDGSGDTLDATPDRGSRPGPA